MVVKQKFTAGNPILYPNSLDLLTVIPMWLCYCVTGSNILLNSAQTISDLLKINILLTVSHTFLLVCVGLYSIVTI